MQKLARERVEKELRQELAMKIQEELSGKME